MLTKKTEKYHHLLCVLRLYWGRVELVRIAIGHAGTTLHDTATGIATALAKVRSSTAAKRKKKGHNKTHETNTRALILDKQIEKNLLDMLYSLAQTRLLGIIAHRHHTIRENATTCTINQGHTIGHTRGPSSQLHTNT
jgi:hypothetical protein